MLLDSRRVMLTDLNSKALRVEITMDGRIMLKYVTEYVCVCVCVRACACASNSSVSGRLL